MSYPLSIDLAGIVLGLLGFVAGAGLATLFCRGVARASRVELQARYESMLDNLEDRLDEARSLATENAAEREKFMMRATQLEHELTQLGTIHAEKRAAFEDMKSSFEQSRAQLKTEFQNLANQILEEKGKALDDNSRRSLHSLLTPLREQIDGFQKRVNQVHDEALRGNVSLSMEIKRVAEMGLKISTEANSLAVALKGDKKTTGNWGELQLERSLELAGLVKNDDYASQPRFKDEQGNARQPDFVIKLPDNKHMVIDSKVSLVDYERSVASNHEADRQAALDAHARAIRSHIDDLSRKDYSNLLGMRSPSFVLMFMPIESAYIAALQHDQGLFDYGYQRNVVMVSHTTLMPILKTVANLWRVARGNEQAHELSARAAEVYNQIVIVAERLKRLGASLDLVSRQYNDTVRAVAGQQGLYGKASRFNELSSKANKTMPAMEPLHADFESERLELIAAGTPARKDSGDAECDS